MRSGRKGRSRMYGALTAFLVGGELPPPTTLDLAKRLIHGDFKREYIALDSPMGTTWAEDQAAELIAKLIEQEIERAKNVQAG